MGSLSVTRGPAPKVGIQGGAVVPGLLNIRITRNDVPLVVKGVRGLETNMTRLMRNIGNMVLDSAQEAMDRGGPGWKEHAPATVRRWGIHELLQLRRGTPPLGNIRNSFRYTVDRKTRRTVGLNIIPRTPHAAKMFFIHNRPMGQVSANRIPGRPFFKWRTGHRADSEETQARRLMREYIGDVFARNGVRTSSVGFGITQPGRASFSNWGDSLGE